MTRVITYGTFDMLHYGHIKLLERAKALGDYLIVGITSDSYDISRGKINNQQSLNERISAVEETGIADEIIVEEYEGQKIDDIRRYSIDIFTVGSDWVGHFDYLNEYCSVIYLPRTDGISSSGIRAIDRKIRLGFVGDYEGRILNKYCVESTYVNGLSVSGICTNDSEVITENNGALILDNYEELLECSDAVYLLSHPTDHFNMIKKALSQKKHVLVEMPVCLTVEDFEELNGLANENKVVLMPAMKTAYATAYVRLLLLAKTGIIGNIVSVDATCTSLRDLEKEDLSYSQVWNSICAWGPTALLPVFQLLGVDYKSLTINSLLLDSMQRYDAFTKIDFLFDNAVGSIKVGRGVKSEGELVVSGTKGYIYVPSPWWKTDYFEVRFENPEKNKRYFYQLDGEGIRYELVEFTKAIRTGKHDTYISDPVSRAVTKVISDYYSGKYNEITL